LRVSTSLIVFILVYIGMFLGRIPRLQLDRTGIALLGALVLMVVGVVPLEHALELLDLPTLALLFGLMVLSAQLRLGGFYHAVATRMSLLPVSPRTLLAVLIATVGVLAAVFTNDVICLAVTPVVIGACDRRGLDPVPYLLAVACAANVGSAATLIGNPQNMLIGQVLQLSFAGYSAMAAAPAIAGLAVIWVILALQIRPHVHVPEQTADPTRTLDRWQTAKGLTMAAALLMAFLVAPWPRELIALGVAGIALTSRKMHSREMLGLVDWQLLVLFAGLFIVNGAFQETMLPVTAVDSVRARGFDITEPAPLLVTTVVLSNLVSNVPAIMLLLDFASHPMAGPILALSSTMAGNLLIVGSIANIIVVDMAGRHGVVIDWRRHARAGVPVTVVTLAITALWLFMRVG
jgi:Na+/H+ antiporter NhaD/arsenite permease-like protein